MKVFVLLITGIWIGMLLGISFVEAPLKFRAPNITLSLGLGIGKLVFAALNKFEIGFSILLSYWLISQGKHLNGVILIVIGMLILCVVVQSIWLLPILDKRAELIISGQHVAKSYHHLYYIVFEVIKLILLIMSFFKTFHYEGPS